MTRTRIKKVKNTESLSTDNRQLLTDEETEPYRDVLYAIITLAIKDSFAQVYYSKRDQRYTSIRYNLNKDIRARRWLTGSDEARLYFELLGLEYESVREKLKDQWYEYDTNNILPDIKFVVAVK